MENIILDSHVIISDPDILAKKQENVTLIVPNTVLLEIESASTTNTSLQKHIEIVQKAEKNGSIVIKDILRDNLNQIHISPGLSLSDSAIIEYTKNINSAESPSSLATEDNNLAEYANKIGIKTKSANDLRRLFEDADVISTNFLNQTKIAKSKLKKYIPINIIISLITQVLAYIVINNINFILENVDIWGTILGIIMLGITLYLLRSKFRLSYGITEMIIGILIATRVYLPEFDYSKLNSISFFSLLGGIYVIVRGIDNIAKGIRGTKIQSSWEKFFGKII